jgi:hypothetical protein
MVTTEHNDRKPGPQRGLCAKLWYCRRVGMTLQVGKLQRLMRIESHIQNGLTWRPHRQCLYQIFTNSTLRGEGEPDSAEQPFDIDESALVERSPELNR